MMKDKSKFIIFILLIVVFQSIQLYSQDETEAVEETEETKVNIAENIHFFVNNNIIFAVSLDNGGFGFGGTVTTEYKTSFNFAFGLEVGYYGIKSESDKDGFLIGGFSLLPIYAVAEYEFELIEDFFSPVLKFGVAYTNARINGWIGGSTASMVFEGGVRVKAFLGGGFLIQGNVFYSGIIEKTGVFSMINLGLGFGF